MYLKLEKVVKVLQNKPKITHEDNFSNKCPAKNEKFYTQVCKEIEKNYTYARDKSLLESWVTAFLPD